MRWRSLLGGLASLALVAAPHPAWAQLELPGWLFGQTPTQPVSGEPVSSITMFNSAEADSHTVFAGGGIKWQPASFQKNGYAVMVSFGHSWWREWQRFVPLREENIYTTRGAVLFGRDFSVGGGTLGVYAGPEFIRESAFDPFALRLRSLSRFGARLQLDWWQKFGDAALLTANFSAGSVKQEIWTRVAYGFSAGSYGYIGPEISMSHARRDTIWRAGLHWAEIPLWRFRFRLAGGVAQQRGRTGAYLSISHYVKY